MLRPSLEYSMKDDTTTVMNMAGKAVINEYHLFFTSNRMKAVTVHSMMQANVWFSQEK